MSAESEKDNEYRIEELIKDENKNNDSETDSSQKDAIEELGRVWH